MFTSVVMATAYIQSLLFSLNDVIYLHIIVSVFLILFANDLTHTHIIAPTLNLINFSPTFKKGSRIFTKVKNSESLNHNLIDSSSPGLTPCETISAGIFLN